MELDTEVKDSIMNAIDECDELFLFFIKHNPTNKEDKLVKQVAVIHEESLFNMIIEILGNPKTGMLNKFTRHAEEILEKIEEKNGAKEENCGRLIEDEIETLFNAMKEREKSGAKLN